MVASGRCADETSPLSKGCRAHAFQKCSIWGNLDHLSNIRFLGLSLLLKSDYLRFSRFRTDYPFAQHIKSHVLNGRRFYHKCFLPWGIYDSILLILRWAHKSLTQTGSRSVFAVFAQDTGSKVKYSIRQSNLPYRYGNSLAIQDRTALPATRQRWHSRLYPSRSWYSIEDAKLSWPSCTDYPFTQHTKSHVLEWAGDLSKVLPPVRDLWPNLTYSSLGP